MERLTTNKEVSEMNVIELAHNSCYAKDRKARYRDFETDIDARELTIKLLEQYADIPNEFTCDDDFEDFMADSLQYGTDDILGLIAVFYRNLWAMANLRGRLKEYEDLEEQGKLLKLPCAVGDIVCALWSVPTEQKYVIYPAEVKEICIGIYNNRRTIKYRLEPISFRGRILNFYSDDFGKKIFLEESEAENALKQMNEMEGKEQ